MPAVSEKPDKSRTKANREVMYLVNYPCEFKTESGGRYYVLQKKLVVDNFDYVLYFCPKNIFYVDEETAAYFNELRYSEEPYRFLRRQEKVRFFWKGVEVSDISLHFRPEIGLIPLEAILKSTGHRAEVDRLYVGDKIARIFEKKTRRWI